jgi:lipoate-protein ligase A
MRLLEVSFESPAENLACDEALLEELEEGTGEPTLRFWESPVHFVVLGYSNKIDTEVNRAECARRGIPILRRSSGGGTVVQGPGCLNYNLTLPINNETASITATNNFVMQRHRDAMTTLLRHEVQIRGCTDLTIGPRKFSGNAQRRKSRALVFHGCFLLNFDLEVIEAALAHPPKEPEYRAHRSHRDFLVNIGLSVEALKKALCETWGVDAPTAPPDRQRVESLIKERYGSAAWNEKF